MRKLLRKLFVDLKIIIIAMIIVVAMVIITKNPNLFTASVLLVQDHQIMVDNQRDIGYKNTGNILDVFISDKIKDFDTIDFSISFDKDSVSMDTQKVESQLKYNIVNNTSGEINIKLFANTGVDYNQSLFTIPFSGSNPFVLLGDAVVQYIGKDNISLSIGNLDEAKTNHQD